LANNTVACQTLDEILRRFQNEIQKGCHVVLMSNGSFGGLNSELVNFIAAKTE
jgi:UDP-N-acetylmuramate-alanine ligase